MLGSVIAVIVDLLAVADTAQVAAIALHTTLQTKQFVEQWHIIRN